MTTDLRHRLDDLLAEVPSYVAPDAATAWQAGRRRRTRRRLLTGATAIVAIAAAAGIATAGVHVERPQPASPPARAVTGYPNRLEEPVLFRFGTLPQRPGPVAGVVQRPDGWYAVSQTGRLWRIPGATRADHPASISPDGSRITYVASSPPSLVTRDLVAGTVSDDDLGPYVPPDTWTLIAHAQTFWSPHSQQMAVQVRPGSGYPRADAAVVSARAGSLPEAVRAPRGSGRLLLAGWKDDRTLVWLRWTPDPQGKNVIGTASALLSDRRGVLERTVRLHVGHAVAPPTSTSVSIAPGGHLLAMGTDSGAGDGSVFSFHLDGPLRGRQQVELPQSFSGTGRTDCPASWGDTIRLPGATYPDTVLRDAGGGTTVYADPRLHISCSVWATDALRGTPYRDLTARLFDDSGTLRMGTTSWLSWHWRQLGLGGAFLLLLAGIGRAVVRGRRWKRA